MASMISTWEQSAVYDPTNPHQIQKVQYAQIPGGYASYYYNRVPTTATLKGALGDVLDPSTWSPTFQMLAVGLLSAVAGFYGWRRYGDSIETRYHKFRGR